MGYFIWRGITAPCIFKEILNEMNLSPSSQGNSCEIEVNECLSQPCQNGASCSDELNSFSCLCPAGTTGTLFLPAIAVSQDEFGWQRPHNYILKLTTMFKCWIESLKLNFRMVTQYRSHSPSYSGNDNLSNILAFWSLLKHWTLFVCLFITNIEVCQGYYSTSSSSNMK